MVAFAAGLDRAGGRGSLADFTQADPESELGLMQRRLQDVTEAIKEKARAAEAALATERGEAEAASATPAAGAAEEGGGAEETGAEAPAQGGPDSSADRPAAPEQPGSSAGCSADPRAQEGPAPGGDSRACREARARMDDAIQVYASLPTIATEAPGQYGP
eukprot:3113207-Lingulodinium_polyedra.AAC.1